MKTNNRDLLLYSNNKLTFDGFAIEKIFDNWKTPFYLYSEKILEDNFLEFFQESLNNGLDSLICFALKANPNKRLLSILARNGAGADIVSGGELIRAIEAGIESNKIVFSGVGKTTEEISLALEKEIYSFNVESIEELELINELALKLNKKARVAFRLNPKVNAKTHKHISTGYKTHKFGIVEEDILSSLSNDHLWKNCELIGLSIHIGSQLTCLDATKEAIIKLCQCARKIPFPLQFLDVGGGLGVDYDKSQKPAPSVNEYMNLVSTTLKNEYPFAIKVIFEPGRKIAASAGIFVTTVIRTKESEGHHFTIVDGGMNDFVRPSLYDAYHEIYPSTNTSEIIKTDIVGPICETADYFAQQRPINKLKASDFIAIADTGAYGHSMSGHYNLRVRPKELLLTKNNTVEIINKCERIEDLL